MVSVTNILGRDINRGPPLSPRHAPNAVSNSVTRNNRTVRRGSGQLGQGMCTFALWEPTPLIPVHLGTVLYAFTPYVRSSRRVACPLQPREQGTLRGKVISCVPMMLMMNVFLDDDDDDECMDAPKIVQFENYCCFQLLKSKNVIASQLIILMINNMFNVREMINPRDKFNVGEMISSMLQK